MASMRWLSRWIVAVGVIGMMASAVPAWGATREGSWSGDTSQGRALRFKVGADERIAFVRVTIDYENENCLVQVRWEFGLSSRIRDDDTFRLDLVDEQDDRDTALILGEFVSNRLAEGTFRSALSEGGGCGELRTKGTWTVIRK